jgi:hypothetical protein
MKASECFVQREGAFVGFEVRELGRAFIGDESVVWASGITIGNEAVPLYGGDAPFGKA